MLAGVGPPRRALFYATIGWLSDGKNYIPRAELYTKAGHARVPYKGIEMRHWKPLASKHPYRYNENGSLYTPATLDGVNPNDPLLLWSRTLDARAATFDDAAAKGLIEPPMDKWTPGVYNPALSMRTGLVMVKVGTDWMWDEVGNKTMVTVLWLPPECSVIGAVRPPASPNKRCYVEIGVNPLRGLRRHVDRPPVGAVANRGMYARRGMAPHMHRVRFHVTPDALLPVGARLDVRHFLPGQAVDILTRTRPRGFQGSISRWGFAEGASRLRGGHKMFRRPGAVGARSWPHRVWANKKLPGYMGHRRKRVVKRIYGVDARHRFIFVAGGVPGLVGQHVLVRDCADKLRPLQLPFPTFVPAAGERLGAMTWQEYTAWHTPPHTYNRDIAGVEEVAHGTKVTPEMLAGWRDRIAAMHRRVSRDVFGEAGRLREQPADWYASILAAARKPSWYYYRSPDYAQRRAIIAMQKRRAAAITSGDPEAFVPAHGDPTHVPFAHDAHPPAANATGWTEPLHEPRRVPAWLDPHAAAVPRAELEQDGPTWGRFLMFWSRAGVDHHYKHPQARRTYRRLLRNMQ